MNQRLAKDLPRENSLVILCSRLLMLQQEVESSRMSMLAKVSLRENSLVFFGAELPMLQHVIKNVNHLINNHDFSGTDKFFITAESKLQLAGLTIDRQKEGQFNCRVMLWAAVGRFSWAGKGRPNLIVVIVIVEGHV